MYDYQVHSSYMFRTLVVFFVIAWSVEVVRLAADDHADYISSMNNIPVQCLPYEEGTGNSWSLSYPFVWAYTFMFEAPIKTNCQEYFRRTNPIKLYLPRLPQAFANVVSQLILAPYEVFIDKLGDALRRFMDKFNMAERFIGIIILLFMMIIFSMCLTVMFWKLMTYPSVIKNNEPIYIEQNKEIKYITRAKRELLNLK